jgi:hypothetical protein
MNTLPQHLVASDPRLPLAIVAVAVVLAVLYFILLRRSS